MPRTIRTANRFFGPAGIHTIGDLAARFRAMRLDSQPLPEAPLAFVCDSGAEACAAAAGLADGTQDALIISRERLTDPVRQALLRSGFHVSLPSGAVEAPLVATPHQPGRVTLLTSGTTGTPKLVSHTWNTLYTAGRAGRATPLRWLMTYQPGTYAWFQVMTMVLFRDGHELVVSAEREPRSLIDAALKHDVSAVSSTPTFWRLALLQIPHDTLGRLRLRQLTLGGEPVDQAVLDRLRSLYPGVTLTHIYASTEVGACIVVSDGREGFPVAWLEAGSGAPTGNDVRDSPRVPDTDPAAERPRLRVEHGSLHVWSPHSSPDARGWFDTGDAAEIQGDRVVIVGRRESSIINVGGTRVSVHGVERILLEDPRVVWCRAYGRSAPLVGELVGIDVVPAPDVAPSPELERSLVLRLQDVLPEPAIPRFWRFLDRIPITDSLKSKAENAA